MGICCLVKNKGMLIEYNKSNGDRPPLLSLFNYYITSTKNRLFYKVKSQKTVQDYKNKNIYNARIDFLIAM